MDDTIILDLTPHEWQCGSADDEGPAEILPAVEDPAERKSQLAYVLEQLEVERAEFKVLLSEQPGASTAQRMEMAAAIFEHGARAVLFVAAPLLALYNAGGTGLLVHIDPTSTHILAFYNGEPVLDACTLVPTSGDGFAAFGGDAPLDVAAIADAAVRTANLVDVSLRAELLGRIVLVGLGSTSGDDADLPDRLAEETRRRLRTDDAPWTVNVVANNDRRLASWLGGSVLCAMPSSERLFVPRAAYRADADAVHATAASLACRKLSDLENHVLSGERAEAEAEASWRQAALAKARAVHADAAAWWCEQAPPNSGAERARQRRWQSGCVREFHDRALHQSLMAPPFPMPALPLPPSACLEVTANALRQLGAVSGVDNDWKLCRQSHHLRATRWAAAMLLGPRDAAAAVAHRQKRLLRIALRRLQAERRARHAEVERLRAAAVAWRSATVADSVKAWLQWWARRLHAARRMDIAVRLLLTNSTRHLRAATYERRQRRAYLLRYTFIGRRANLQRGYRRWRCNANALADSAALLTHATRLLASWRVFQMWWRRASQARGCQLKLNVLVCRKLYRGLRREWRAWADIARAQVEVMMEWKQQRACADEFSVRRSIRRVWVRLEHLAEGRKHGKGALFDAITHHRLEQICFFWVRIQDVADEEGQKKWLARVATTHSLLSSWGRFCAGSDALSRLSKIATREAALAPMIARRLRLSSLGRGISQWYAGYLVSWAERQLAEWLVQRKLMGSLLAWKEGAHYLRVIRRAKLRQVANKARRGQRTMQSASLRRGFLALRANWSVRRSQLASLEISTMQWNARRAAILLRAITYWCAEAKWRKQRLKWMQRQVRYMTELQDIMNSASDGKRWARGLRSIGVDPNTWSEGKMRSVRRSCESLERALEKQAQRKQKQAEKGAAAAGLTPSTAPRKAEVRVLAPGIDSWLEEVLE